MRIGGSTPFNPSGAFPVALGPGSYSYIPPGNYLCSLGAQTCVEWWDPVQSAWRVVAWPNEQFPISVDGYNYRLINRSGVVVGASITNAGSGGTNGIGPTQTGATVSVAGPGGNGQAAKGYAIVGGSLPSLSVSNGGSGFVVPPLILIDPPPLGGIQATAVSQITSAGVLTSATLVNVGAGYTSLPNVYVVPQFLDYPGQLALPYTVPTSPTPVAPNFPPGQIQNIPPQNFQQGLQQAFPVTGGALVNFGAGVLGGSGTLTGLVITDYGSLYNTSVPAISFAGGGLAGGVAATALMSWAVTTAPNVTYATLAVGTPLESNLGLLSATTNFYNNGFLWARPFRGRVPAASTNPAVVDDAGFGFQTVLGTGSFGSTLNAGAATSTATFAGTVMGGINDTSILQAFIN